MGISISAQADGSQGRETGPSPSSTTGFHVLKVKENSPASFAGIEPFFDFIVAANGQRLNEQNSILFDIVNQFIDHELKLVLYNSKTQDFRESIIVPTKAWDGDGLLGCSLRFCNFEYAAEHVWHVMEIYPNSPASEAGLRPNHDYIIGTPDVVIKDKNDLFMLVETHIGKPLRLYVYNWETDMTRESNRKVAIIPDPEWGGEGALGCDIGFGYLHRIPKIRSSLLNQQQLQNHQQNVVLADFSTLSTVEGDQGNKKKTISESSLMEPSASMVSLPDTALQHSPRNDELMEGEFTQLDMKGKSKIRLINEPKVDPVNESR